MSGILTFTTNAYRSVFCTCRESNSERDRNFCDGDGDMQKFRHFRRITSFSAKKKRFLKNSTDLDNFRPNQCCFQIVYIQICLQKISHGKWLRLLNFLHRHVNVHSTTLFLFKAFKNSYNAQIPFYNQLHLLEQEDDNLL
jgi:hypothetical protein